MVLQGFHTQINAFVRVTPDKSLLCIILSTFMSAKQPLACKGSGDKDAIYNITLHCECMDSFTGKYYECTCFQVMFVIDT